MGTGLKQTFITGLTETGLTDKEGVGTIRYSDGKWYKYVKYLDGTGSLDIVTGDALVYTSVTGYLDNTVTADLTDGDGLCVAAGMAIATVTVDLTFMWMQIKGAAVLSTTPGGTTPVDGDAICAGLTAGTDKIFIVDPPDNRNRAGVVQDVSALTCILDCPF